MQGEAHRGVASMACSTQRGRRACDQLALRSASAQGRSLAIAMVLLSRVLTYRANRRANIIAGAATIAFVIGGGSTAVHYLFLATIEIACMALIIRYAWKWADPEGRSDDKALDQGGGARDPVSVSDEVHGTETAPSPSMRALTRSSRAKPAAGDRRTLTLVSGTEVRDPTSGQLVVKRRATWSVGRPGGRLPLGARRS